LVAHEASIPFQTTIVIQTANTDVFIIGLSYFSNINQSTKLYLEAGHASKISKKFIDLSFNSQKITREMERSIAGFTVLRGVTKYRVLPAKVKKTLSIFFKATLLIKRHLPRLVPWNRSPKDRLNRYRLRIPKNTANFSKSLVIQ
jgi:hypothetical protein